MNLKEKVVIITGAGSGIGAATAKLFGTHGATVVTSDINLENTQKVADEIKAEGGMASIFPVTDMISLSLRITKILLQAISLVFF